MFPIQNDLIKGDALSLLLFKFASEYALGELRTIWHDWNERGHTSCRFLLKMEISMEIA
jgi:hypothetical protein